MAQEAHLRIGDVSERTGLEPSRLRQWERRYGFPDPHRTEGGHRLYSTEDVEDLRRVKRWIEEGILTSKAVERVAASRDDGKPALDEHVEDLVDTLLRGDIDAAGRVLDRAHARHTLPTVVGDVIAPTLWKVGERWQAGEVSVAQEHLTSSYLRHHVRGLLEAERVGGDRPVVVGTPPGEKHEIGALCTAAILARDGFPVRYIGPDVPLPAVASFAEGADSRAAVLSATRQEALADLSDDALADLSLPVLVGGRGATPEEAGRLGAEHMGEALDRLGDRLGHVGD
jgi:DNA-binding transcriptional MerR regulator